MLTEKYFIVVLGTFSREPLICDEYPDEKKIEDAILSLQGNSARVEKRFVIESDSLDLI